MLLVAASVRTICLCTLCFHDVHFTILASRKRYGKRYELPFYRPLCKQCCFSYEAHQESAFFNKLGHITDTSSSRKHTSLVRTHHLVIQPCFFHQSFLDILPPLLLKR